MGTLISVVGAILGLIGIALAARPKAFRALNLAAAVLLLIGAILSRHLVFSALELVIVLGAILAYVPWNDATKSRIVILVAVAVAVGVMSAANRELDILGSVGLGIIAVGNARQSVKVLTIGAAVMLAYCGVDYVTTRASISAVFLGLEAAYVAVGLRQLFR